MYWADQKINVISRYCFNGSTVYGCFLDASKAFDHVDHTLLFEKLLQRHLSPVVVRILLAWYTDQRAGILWNGSLSHKFSISNGLWQGGVLSPILFTVYMDDLLVELERQGVDCVWKHHFAGAVCYADDTAQIAPSPSALRLMLQTCIQFTSSHSPIFNASKTQLIKFSSCSTGLEPAKFSFCGEKLSYSRSITHLGHILSCDLLDNLDITAIKQDMCRKANHMLATFRPCDPFTKTKLMQGFCLSLYGSLLWMASSKELHSLEVAYNNLLRRIWNLPCNCHTDILHRVGGVNSILIWLLLVPVSLLLQRRELVLSFLLMFLQRLKHWCTLVLVIIASTRHVIGEATVMLWSCVPSSYGMPRCALS